MRASSFIVSYRQAKPSPVSNDEELAKQGANNPGAAPTRRRIKKTLSKGLRSLRGAGLAFLIAIVSSLLSLALRSASLFNPYDS